MSSDEFSKHGFKQASLNRIIAQVGMSKSSFYHYFSDKSDLFRQTLEHTLKPALDLHHLVDIDNLTADTLWPALMQMVQDMKVIVEKSPEMVTAGRMFYRCLENNEDRALTEEIIGDFSNWITLLLQRGQALGIFRTDLPESLLIDMLMAMGMAMDRWILTHYEDLSEPEMAELTENGFDLFLHFLSPIPG
ncbi:MAG: TetR/AcrR family transcriptional regulator [Rhodobacterales bacterium]|nr:TetR/AcrR family transcriptional regulator [Rhodobacterales bacterium]